MGEDDPGAEEGRREARVSRVEGRQSFSIEQAQTEMRAQAAAHRQSEASKEADFRRDQESKDKRLQRIRDGCTYAAFMVVVLTALGVCLWVGIWSKEPETTKQWARSITTLIIGGFLGYVTGRSVK